jgi:SAM-dependent methyltransferase
MFKTYKDIFNQRGLYYHQAMVEYPYAREEEFYHTINLAEIKEGNIVCDVPSGGGYLNNFLKDEAKIISVETSAEFLRHCKNKNVGETIICNSLNEIPLEAESVDRVISLAALHHESNKKDFYQESLRLLKNDGLVCLADVMEGTGVSKFLNIFVNEYNSMGHKGEFFNEDTKKDLESIGFDISYASSVSFDWKFDSLKDMVNFCKLLFYIDRADDMQILHGIEKYLEYEKIGNRYYLNWELYFLVARKCNKSDKSKS